MILDYNYFLCVCVSECVCVSACRVLLVIEIGADTEVKYQGPVWSGKPCGGNILPVLSDVCSLIM